MIIGINGAIGTESADDHREGDGGQRTAAWLPCQDSHSAA
jgi:hypothetical protein